MAPARSNWTIIAFGLALAAFGAYQQFKLPPALPALLETYRYDRTLAGGFMSVYAVAGLALSIVLGRWIERSGSRQPLLLALAVLLLGNLLGWALVHDGMAMLAGRALEGLGFAVFAILGPVLANSHAAPRHLPLVIALTASWIPAGQIAATLVAAASESAATRLGEGLLPASGWPLLWLTAILGTLALAVWTWRLEARGPLIPRAARTVESEPPAAPLTPGQRLRLWIAGAIFMLWACQYFAYMTWLPQYLVEVRGLPLSLALLGYLLPVSVLITTNILTGLALSAGAPLGPVFLIGLSAQVVIWWLVPVTPGGILGLLSLVFYGIGAGITPTSLFAMPSALAGRGAPSAFGILMTGRNLGVLAGPVLLAQAFKMTGGWDIAAPLFGTVTGLALLLALPLAWGLRETRYGTRR